MRGDLFALGLGPRHFHQLRPHRVLPAGVAGDRQDDLAVLEENEAWGLGPVRLAFVAVEEGGTHGLDRSRPTRFRRHEVGVGGIDDLVVELGKGIRFLEFRLGLGTPDLAAASKFVTDEHQHRLPGLGLRDAGQ